MKKLLQQKLVQVVLAMSVIIVCVASFTSVTSGDKFQNSAVSSVFNTNDMNNPGGVDVSDNKVISKIFYTEDISRDPWGQVALNFSTEVGSDALQNRIGENSINNVYVGINRAEVSLSAIQVSAVPIPSAVWLFCSGLIGLIGVARRK